MPRVPPFDRPATYDDLLALPDTVVGEIVDGQLHASPRPTPKHANTEDAIGVLIRGPFHHGLRGPGGWLILSEAELHLEQDVVVPDWSGWRRERMSAIPDTAYVTLPPDWICEVLSPSTSKIDRTKKLAIYAREGVGHAWLIDPLAHTLEVLRLERGHWMILATHIDNDIIRAEPFAEIELNLRDLWAD